MPEPHPVYSLGPYAFIALSCLLSVWIAPKLRRKLEAWLAKRGPRAPIDLASDEVVMIGGVAVSAVHVFRRSPVRSPLVLSTVSMVASVVALWGAATAIAWLLLLVPGQEPADRLPGQEVDAAVIAHAVPTTALAAADALVERLERGGGATRWSPPGELEARLVLAGRMDPRPERAVRRLTQRGYRTRAGLFALGHPSDETCADGLDALAESLRGGSLQSLMTACRNSAGDHVARAAFKMGDFMRSVGPEAEAIVSRLPRPPADEPDCLAGGFDLPDPKQPLCRLIHAEMAPRTRAEALTDPPLTLPIARRWAAAMRAELGQDFDDALLFTIDPERLLERPLEAVIDQPIGVYLALRESSRAELRPAEAAWVRLAAAASRSAMGRDRDALLLLDEAHSQLLLGASDDEWREASRLSVAIALRAGDFPLAELYAERLDGDDPLHRWPASGSNRLAPSWASLVESGDPGALASALGADPSAHLGGLLRLRGAPDEARPALREWLREAFPACERCELHAQLDRLTVRYDGARALGDEALIAELEPVVARFEAVFENRLLALSLRAANPGPLPN